MDNALYVAMTGAKQTMLAQAINSNNLANVNTSGFRADLYNAKQVALFGDTFQTTTFAASEKPETDLTPAAVHTTGGDLDIAIEGEGYFAVQRPDGSQGYTRGGELHITAAGQLQTAQGFSVVGNGGPIAIPPAEKVLLGGDGTISIRPPGGAANSLAVLDRLKLVKPDAKALTKAPDGLLVGRGDEEIPSDPSVKVLQGAIEDSNVNAVDAMVNIISLARQFEMQVKVMEQTDSNGKSLAQLLQLS